MQNSITVYREKPLSEEQFLSLDRHAKRCFSINRKMVGKSVPKHDHDGNIYAWEHDLVPCGFEVLKKEEPKAELMASLCRPADHRAIIVHITRLSAHKKFTEGDAGWSIIQADLCKFLEGCSEYAIMATVENYILDRSNKWFPLTADLVADVKSLDDQLRWSHDDAPKKAPSPPKEDFPIKRTTKSRRRVGKIVKIGMKQAENWTKWEKRFMDAIKRQS